jgi:predicted nucleic acid-binding protein
LEDNADQLVVLDLVLMEVLRGFAHDHEWRLARDAFADLPLATAGGEAVALRAADLYRQQRRRGITIRSPIDLMVAAWCLEHSCALLHADRDFDGIEGLANAS